jgi:hypothetical protein
LTRLRTPPDEHDPTPRQALPSCNFVAADV